jgi:succinate dehydrogenase/fumarate reductase flavoprotein subunit/ferredoxin
MYSIELKESISRIEFTREKRLKEDYPRLPEDERCALVRQNHANDADQGRRELLVGPNKGDCAPQELAELLEGNSLVDPDRVDLGAVDYDIDVLVLGSGGAGAAAALSAQEKGANVLLVTKLGFFDSDTMRFEGGIQAANRSNDSPVIHYLDTMGGGFFDNIPDLVEVMVRDAPSIVQWLESLGCMFVKEADGTLRTEFGEGTSRKRVHHARGCLGLEIMRNLYDELCNRGIPVLEYLPAIELIMDDTAQIAGAILINLESKKEAIRVRAKTVVLATGGDGQLHYQGFPCTDHYGAMADGLAMAYRAGAKSLLLDAIQYIPTGIIFPEQMVGQPVDEKIRRLGAKFANIKGEQFIYHLETDDVLTSAMIRECKNGFGIKTPKGLNGIWLDTPMIEVLHGPGTIQKELPSIYDEFKTFNIDITKEPILVFPSQYFSNGGIKIDSQGATSIPNLYAAGKVCGGVHGRHLLKDNLLLDVLVFGRRAGKAAAERAKEVKLGKLTLEHLRKWRDELKRSGLQKQSIAPKLIPDYAKHGKVIRADWLRRERFEIRKEEERPRLKEVDINEIELILNEILDTSAPPVARARLLSKRGLSGDNRLDIMENVIGAKTCLGCGNCNDVCPIIAREPHRRERTPERTSMALETVLLAPEECDRCYACIIACPQVDTTIKYYVVNRRMIEVVSWLDSRIGDKDEPDLDLFIEEALS